MKNRIQIDETTPAAYKGMFELENFLQKSSLSKTHLDLIKIRASQINGCAFCIDMHTKEALKNGEAAQRLFLLNAWKENDSFTQEEKILLQMTEEVTLIHNEGLRPETYQRATEKFSDTYFSEVIMAIVAINSWNRIAISTHKPIPEQ